ncbi:MAG TPA: hypothetical protein VI386_15610 [Candidatus Sulfotelmatobacter sp.]
MTRTQKIEIWTACLITLLITAAAILLVRWHTRRAVTLQGAVMVQDSDPRKELPIADVLVSTSDDPPVVAKSDSSGFFHLTMAQGIRRGRPVTLHFRHKDYQPLDLDEFVGDKLYVANLVPRAPKATRSEQQQIKVGNVRIRFSIKTQTELNIGSAAQTFVVENKGNIPCKGRHPCSPDGKWKASLGSLSLDAGTGNEFRDARASCIAGPCPFTRVESDRFSQGGRTIMVTARNWSDSATFLLEAEVFHPMASELVHESYPVIFGDALNFTLPASAEAINIEADINGQTIIFPMGPDMLFSWATCNARINSDRTHVYRCELKPGFRFQ